MTDEFHPFQLVARGANTSEARSAVLVGGKNTERGQGGDAGYRAAGMTDC